MAQGIQGMLFRVEVDAESGKISLREFGRTAERTKDQVVASGDKMSASMGGLSSNVKSMTATIAAAASGLFLLKQAVDRVNDAVFAAVEAWSELEVNLALQEVILNATGVAVEGTTAELKKQAEELGVLGGVIENTLQGQMEKLNEQLKTLQARFGEVVAKGARLKELIEDINIILTALIQKIEAANEALTVGPGLSLAGLLIGKIPGIGKLQDAAAVIERIADAIRKIPKAPSRASKDGELGGDLPVDVGGAFTIEEPVLREMHEELAKITKEAERLEAVYERAAAKTDRLERSLNKLVDKNKMTVEVFGDFSDALDNVAIAGEGPAVWAEAFTDDVENLSFAVLDLVGNLDLLPGTLKRAEEAAADLPPHIKAQTEVLDMMKTAAIEASAAALHAFFTGSKGAKEAVAGIIDALSKEALVRAVMELAAGFATMFTNPIESASHFKSAALYGSVGAVAGVVAGSLNRSAAGDRREPSFTSRSPSVNDFAEPSQRPLEVTIILEGQGYIQDMDEFVRDLTRQIQVASSEAGA